MSALRRTWKSDSDSQLARSGASAPGGQVPDPPPYGTCPIWLVTRLVPEFTKLLAAPMTCAGFNRIHIPSVVANTIHTEDSRVSVIRFRTSPYHPNQTAPRMTMVGMSGRQIP